ncbi:hypothetical protein GMST_14350 [Geomonas silvestris]|uniref:Uncharacterized protein n=1 Tax=Geomonas silvestris TaxID=2740184 RepID=A0A6V8MGK0_9BACT|nr:hypothetical protein GMST_14350 [Geomonas silvestris]
MYGIPLVAAGARIHGGNEHDSRRVGDAGEGAGDGDPAVLHGLAQHLEDMLLELGKLVQEKDAVVRERDLAWLRGIAAVTFDI